MILSIHSTFVSIAKKVPAVLKLFNTFVMRENKGKCFSPLAQKYFFGFTHHKAQQKIIIQRHTKFFYLTHSLENYTRFFTKMFIGLLS
jgi:hypothetical protein